jgi:cytochrome oxidase Cu insertion factor (SCO1/SenC/PrrC family)
MRVSLLLLNWKGFFVKKILVLLFVPGFVLMMSACTSVQANTDEAYKSQSVTAAPTKTPDWFDIELTDVQTGQTFTMNDYAGKVVLVETMAMWCPTCVIQATQVEKFHNALGNPEDLITVSLDVDIHEDAASLKEYASSYRFNWHFAIAPLEVARALGNLYNAEYLNPPLSPMLLIDRDGNVHQLEYGVKDAETLQKFTGPYLTQ